MTEIYLVAITSAKTNWLDKGSSLDKDRTTVSACKCDCNGNREHTQEIVIGRCPIILLSLTTAKTCSSH